MKKLILLMCMAAFAAPAGAQRRGDASGARLEFKTTEHNFGKIDERGKKVSCTFEFANNGTSPLIITRVEGTCKCMSFNYPKKPIPPGEKGTITVTYNPRKQGGVFYKVIQVYANTSDQRHMITVRGEVISEE